MIGKYLRKALTIAGIVYFTHINYYRIEKTLNTFKYISTSPEPGFVENEQAFDLRIIYERNHKGTLETYLKNDGKVLPILKRDSGILIGTAEENFKNFSEKERKTLCLEKLTKNEPMKDPDTYKQVIGKMWDIWAKKE